ncbi:MAG: tRNA preQ1(34) S-adenosylmethionine ribosyltransferase-isomerase QueA [Gammaproteobacteria bacterium]|nr:tRNA preQ1(34) S-adenosylmethionine ribosyltransferase-isomerase QueA [Gammaproteobacteria bacterium]
MNVSSATTAWFRWRWVGVARVTNRRSDFRFDLPPSLIAQHPIARRSASRLLVLRGDSIDHCRFEALVDMLTADDVLVVNDSRVIKARLVARKDSGGQAEILVERVDSDSRAICQVRVSKALKPGRFLELGEHRIDVVERVGEFYLLDFNGPVDEFLDAHGRVPLPPYIDRDAQTEDEERYQTVYAREPGAVAAPTAGLHFDEDLLARLRANGVGVVPLTLHVGAGTFQPVRQEDLSQHRMHEERYAVPPTSRQAIDACRGRVVAVGTTVVRALESAAATGCDRGETRLFITPGYGFRAVDALVTNFHLPESTLLMLVSAFAGVEPVRRAYREAVRHRYRFFSYGDAMFCERAIRA